MDTQHLSIFISVADAGSFTKAGYLIGKSPQALFKQITTLEERIKVRLFDRSPTGLTLTSAGKSLYKDAKYLISFSKEALSRAREIERNDGNLIRIGISPFTSAKFLSKVWPIAIKQYPNLKAQLIPFDSDEATEWDIQTHLGSEGKIDILLCAYDDNFLTERRCDALKLRDLHFTLSMTASHKLSNERLITLDRLAEFYSSAMRSMSVTLNTRLASTPQARGGVLIRRHSWFKSYDILKNLLSSAQIPCQLFENLSMDVLNLCENSQNLFLGIDAWVFSHPLLKTIPFDTELTLPFGVLHSRKPSTQVKKFLRIVDFVNIEYKNFELW